MDSPQGRPPIKQDNQDRSASTNTQTLPGSDPRLLQNAIPPNIGTQQPRLTKSRPTRASSGPGFSSPSLSGPDLSIVTPALKFGGYSAAAGAFVGSFFGIVRSNRPVVFSVATGVQWGFAGTSFAGARSLALWGQGDSRGEAPESRLVADVLASAAAGATAGGVGNGLRAITPGAVVFGVVGIGGHYVYEWQAEWWRKREQAQQIDSTSGLPWYERAMRSKWLPVRKLSEEEYRELLEKKLLRVEAEIAVLEDDIKEIKQKNGIEKG